MQFDVTIDFRKGPSFSARVNADDEGNAKDKGLKFARDCGFNGKAKKITVRPA